MVRHVAVAGVSRGQCTSLASLEILPFGSRFRVWIGRSGRRYVFSCFPIDHLPTFEGAVAIGLKDGPDGAARPIWIASADDRTALSKLACLLGGAATEVHLHLLARDEESRLAAIADLRDAEPSANAVRSLARQNAGRGVRDVTCPLGRSDPARCGNGLCNDRACPGV